MEVGNRMNQSSGNGGGSLAPGGLMRLAGAELSGNGFAVLYPEREEEGARSMILTTSAGMRSLLTVMDAGTVTWDCPPAEHRAPDPRHITDVVTGILTGDHADHGHSGPTYSGDDLTLKGIVGRELRARGFYVELDVYADDEFLDVEADIVVTSSPERTDAEIRVRDDGRIWWERRYAQLRWADMTFIPEYSVTGMEEEIARDVAGILARAMLTPVPARTRRQRSR